MILGLGTGCPDEWGKGGRMDMAMERDLPSLHLRVVVLYCRVVTDQVKDEFMICRRVMLTLLLTGVTGCPHNWRKGGAMDMAMEKDLQQNWEIVHR